MMKFLRCGGKTGMNNDDVENSYKVEEQPSRNVIESSEERRSDEAKAHGWWLLPKKTYDLIKENKPESDWSEIDDDTVKQERPRRNTVLHIAALYGNDKCVEKIVEIGPELLKARNSNEDTPLHVAARAGKISTLEILLVALLRDLDPNSEEAKATILVANFQGNTFFHEALLNGHKNVINILDSSPGFKQLAEDTAFTRRNRSGKSVLHLAIEKGYRDIVDDLLTRVIPRYQATTEHERYFPCRMRNKGELMSATLDMQMAKENLWTILQSQRDPSPPIEAILKDILEKIVNKKKEWIHGKDHKKRNAVHHAASIGYLDGVQFLLESCDTCHMERDKDGFFPLHLASAYGHTEVVKKLLELCPNPREIVDEKGRNIIHIAAIKGQFNVIRYILQDAKDEVKDMINDKDYDGNTPLHWAASYCHPKVVQALTWDTRIDLHCLNNNHQTALDAFKKFKQEDNPTFPQASFTLPGGTNSSTPRQGMAIMLHHVWFKSFIFCITVSMYGGISVIIILIWAQLGDITLAIFALEVAAPVLGVTLATLSVAFLAGVHLAISNLSWLATTIMILSVIFILLLLLLYILLCLPSASSNRIMRWISYFPFKILTWLFEKSSTEGIVTLHDIDTDIKELEEHEYGGKQTEETEELEYGGKQTEETEETEEVDEGENEKDDNDC
ncbi:hypothetical protein LR48_Vigan05g036900 [Vigna angularis]|uniref:PGG domain-containing protein n=1 Tax=Phaseolus angularis TaxID=3914 RepID=A0A0L9UIP2_PHAAN|nr:hypothetical protein LR48_Vigan05g036900 [Vigna angularis]